MAVAYGNGVWVAVGVGGNMFSSSDTRTWNQVEMDDYTTTLYAVTFWPAKSMFIAVGTGMGIIVSTDNAQSFQVVNEPMPNTADLKGVTFTNSGLFAMTKQGHVVKSSDGMQWALGNPGVAGNQTFNLRNFFGTLYSPGVGYVYVGTDGEHYTAMSFHSLGVMSADIAVLDTPIGPVYGLATSPVLQLLDSSWNRQGGFRPNGDNMTIAIASLNNQQFIAGGGDGIYLSDTSSIGPKNFHYVWNGGRVWGLAVNGQTVVACGDCKHNSCIVVSTDGGKSWNQY